MTRHVARFRPSPRDRTRPGFPSLEIRNADQPDTRPAVIILADPQVKTRQAEHALQAAGWRTTNHWSRDPSGAYVIDVEKERKKT